MNVLQVVAIECHTVTIRWRTTIRVIFNSITELPGVLLYLVKWTRSDLHWNYLWK